MRITILRAGLIQAVFTIFAATAFAQSGGTFEITQSVIAGGGSGSSGGDYTVNGTVGQTVAGTRSTGGTYSLGGGFWAESPLAPTSAPVSLSGRVVTERGGGPLRRIRIFITDLSTGGVRHAVPNQFGYFHVDDLAIGTYLIRLESRNFQFTPNEVVVSLLDSVSGMEFTAVPIR